MARAAWTRGGSGAQVAAESFLLKLLPCMATPGVRLVHSPPGYANVAPGADVFDQVRAWALFAHLCG